MSHHHPDPSEGFNGHADRRNSSRRETDCLTDCAAYQKAVGQINTLSAEVKGVNNHIQTLMWLLGGSGLILSALVSILIVIQTRSISKMDTVKDVVVSHSETQAREIGAIQERLLSIGKEHSILINDVAECKDKLHALDIRVTRLEGKR